jgi:hypothetical protein
MYLANMVMHCPTLTPTTDMYHANRTAEGIMDFHSFLMYFFS